MALTITNTNTLTLLNIVNRTSNAQSNTLTQLSTGLKINKGSDDPAGMIVMESLRAELTAVNAAIGNNQRADSLLTVADGAMAEVSSLLNEVESLVAASASDGGMSAAERSANQSQIDSALASIDRIINTTRFNGKQLLNGSQSILTTGVDTSKTADLRVYSRGQSTSDFSITTAEKTAAAQASAAVTWASGEKLTEATEIVIVGTEGTASISLATDDTAANIITKINAATATTGVTATDDGDAGNDNFSLATSGTGSDEYVSLEVLSGGTTDGASSLDTARTTGADAVVTVNGTDVTADGKSVYYSANGYDISFTFEAADTFTIKATGGMTFQMGTTADTRRTIGVDSLATYRLGGGDSGGKLSQLKSGGVLDLSKKKSASLKVVQKAISDVAAARGRIGGFQKFTVQTSINSLNATKIGLSDAKSVVSETDYATATAELNRQSVLLNSGIQLLGLANQQASQILSLLG